VQARWSDLRHSGTIEATTIIAIDHNSANAQCLLRKLQNAGGVNVTFRKWRLGAMIAAWLTTGPALAQDTLADPAGSGVLVSAVGWLQGTLLGTIATVVAVIAVASVGFMMLTGRINWRYGVTVIIGCFIVFGAASIVAGIQSTAGLGN
jgi:type IV secretion system protein VirB2